MPISNNFLLKSQAINGNIDLTGISGLNTSYRYVEEGYYQLEPNKPLIIVPATPSKTNREIYIKYKEDLNSENTANINLYFKSKNQHPKNILIGGEYLDTSDGGIALIAECKEQAIIEVIVRQDSEIDYLIGNYLLGDDEMPIELILRPLIETGLKYSMPPVQLSSIGEENVRRLIDSNNGQTTGCKVWAIDQFQPGKTLNFNINFQNGIIGQGRKIIINLTPIEAIMKAVISLEAGINLELDENLIQDLSLIGWVKSQSYYSEIDPVPGIFTLKPSHTRYVLSFDCENPATPGYPDTIISSYMKNNADPYNGGIFTFLGF
ncbi:hypothetical protein [Planktothrix sp.]|uniref:hypothetical protein n=1 Tax=Planktothrix sp. TaxID=3088171 RepID=UPI0038D41FA1